MALFIGVVIWFVISILLVIILGIYDATSLYRAFALAGPYAVLGIIVSLICKKVERYRIPDSWWAIIAALFYISILIASISLGSVVTWVVLKFISSL